MLGLADPFEVGDVLSRYEHEQINSELALLLQGQISFSNREDQYLFNQDKRALMLRGLEAESTLAGLQTEGYATEQTRLDSLAEEARLGNDARFAITLANMGLVRSILLGRQWGTPDRRSWRYLRQLEETPALSLEDLFEAGLLELHKCLPAWEPEQSSLFGYAKYRVANGIQRTLDRARPISPPIAVHVVKRGSEADFRTQYEASEQLSSEEIEIRSIFETTEVEHFLYREDRDEDPDEELIRDLALLQPDALSADTIDPAYEIDEEIERQAAIQELERAREYVDEREWKVLVLRFGLDNGRPRTLEEVGEFFSLTRERIRQIESKAVEKIQSQVVAERYPEIALTILKREVSTPAEKVTTEPSTHSSDSILSGVITEVEGRSRVNKVYGKVPKHEAINIYLDALRIFRDKHATSRRLVTYKKFYEEVGISYCPFFSAIHTATDLIDARGRRRPSPLRIELHSGAVTPLGAEKILEKCSGPHKSISRISIVRLMSYIDNARNEAVSNVNHVKDETQDTMVQRSVYENIGKFVIDKGLLLIDPETGLKIDPQSFVDQSAEN